MKKCEEENNNNKIVMIILKQFMIIFQNFTKFIEIQMKTF